MLRTENPELLSMSLGSARRAFLDTASVSFSSWENLPVLQERQPKVPTPDKAQSFPLGLFVALCGWVTCEPKNQGVCWDKHACYQRRDAQHLLAYSWWSMNNSPVPAAGPKGVFHMQFETPQSRNSHGFLFVPALPCPAPPLGPKGFPRLLVPGCTVPVGLYSLLLLWMSSFH